MVHELILHVCNDEKTATSDHFTGEPITELVGSHLTQGSISSAPISESKLSDQIRPSWKGTKSEDLALIY